jgi:hypothetical protein
MQSRLQMKAVISQEIHGISRGVYLSHEHVEHFIFGFWSYGNVSFRDCQWEDGMVCGHTLLMVFFERNLLSAGGVIGGMGNGERGESGAERGGRRLQFKGKMMNRTETEAPGG